MNPLHPFFSRREFLNRFGMGLGGMALADLLARDAGAAPPEVSSPDAVTPEPGVLEKLHFAPKAKRVIYLFMAGGPSQVDLFDYKPLLDKRHGEPLPDSVRDNQRLTGKSSHQSLIPLIRSPFKFKQHGGNGAWFSELLPHTASIVDKLCILRAMHTEAINHGPGVTFLQTGSQIAGRPSIGAWLSYGLGQEAANMPAFVVLVTKDKMGEPLSAHLWGSGFMPSRHQAVQFRPGPDPVLYLGDPLGVDRRNRRKLLDRLRELHEHRLSQGPDASIETRIGHYEMAFRMQQSIPEATDFSKEPEHVLESYGPDVHTPGTFAANCLLARRLAERGVRFIQLYHQDWDHHVNLPNDLRLHCQETDQPSAALVNDLERRGMLDDTLVIWGGEFGRTNYCQGKIKEDFGRDHHPRCFTTWMAGGGARPGLVHGETCEFGYNVVQDGLDVHDFHATLLYLLGIDHERLTYKFQGRRFRLTDVFGKVVHEILA